MNKTEFVKAVATETSKSQKEIKETLEVMQKVAFAEMAAEGEVKLFDGLTLLGVHKDACVKRSPATGESVNVPEKTIPKAKFGAICKRVVNGEE